MFEISVNLKRIMMKLFLLILLFSCSIVSLYGEKLTEYKASNGITYHVGDTIKLGRGSAPNGDFNYLQMGGMYNSLSALNGSYKEIGSGIGRNYSGLNVIVKKIKEGKFKGAKKVIFVVGGGNITNYNLMIEDALSTGEVVDPTKKNDIKESSGTDKYSRLKELKQLLDDGVLTQEEFDAEKQKVLDSK